MPPSISHRPPPPTGRPSGSRIVVGLLGLGLALAAFALAFQWQQTDNCLDFYGSDVARAITTAPHVELWHLADGAAAGHLVATGRCDVSRSPGLVHLRRGLVEDANFAWGPPASQQLPSGAWAAALVFSAAPGAGPSATLAFGFGPDAAALCVVGQPGRVGLGRLGRGLRTWVEATCPRPESSPAAGK